MKVQSLMGKVYWVRAKKETVVVLNLEALMAEFELADKIENYVS